MGTFELIFEFGKPVAAIIPDRISAGELRTIYQILVPESYDQPTLAQRWDVTMVICPATWAREQLRRVPMFKPRGIRLQLCRP